MQCELLIANCGEGFRLQVSGIRCAVRSLEPDIATMVSLKERHVHGILALQHLKTWNLKTLFSPTATMPIRWPKSRESRCQASGFGHGSDGVSTAATRRASGPPCG